MTDGVEERPALEPAAQEGHGLLAQVQRRATKVI